VRVFLDSNVLVSAFGTRGLCTDVLRLVLTEHELLTAEAVLEEVERVLTHKFGMPAREMEGVLSFFRENPVESRPKNASSIRNRDPADAWVLASAIAAGADVLVTGDAALVQVHSRVRELKITTPRGFWDLHR
jgi:putative PIN family toxin of toxin-antitoxin system